MKCKNCKGKNLRVRETTARDGTKHLELFCEDCLVFQRFISKEEAARLAALQSDKN